MAGSDLKSAIIQAVEHERNALARISRSIHANPEIGFQEEKAAGWLTEYLEARNFTVERGICELPTAFRARYGRGKPVIAILAEYDALPKLGHACGHNIIAASAVGAGAAARLAVDEAGGQVLVIGTPGEEIQGGKAMMLEKGAFEGIDAAMMVHPGSINSAVTQALACQGLNIEFFGRAAHAAARPEAGINALEAMILSFNGINSLRQHIRSTARVHGIITDGGEAANIVPGHAAGSFMVRAVDDSYLGELKERVLDCFAGAAAATGARLEYGWSGVCYAPMLNNLALARLFAANMGLLKRRMSLTPRDRGFGSTDMGNVSQIVPSIHPLVAIAPPGTLAHSPAFQRAAGQQAARTAMLDSARAMAMTVADLLSQPDALDRVKTEFENHKKPSVAEN